MTIQYNANNHPNKVLTGKTLFFFSVLSTILIKKDTFLFFIQKYSHIKKKKKKSFKKVHIQEHPKKIKKQSFFSMRTSNHLIGLVNFLTFLASIPILGGGIWLSSRANNTDCLKFLQWPLIVIGVSIMVVSLAGFAGACYRNTFLMYLYLWAMFFIIAALIGFVIFAYAVTDKGSGRPVMNRVYSEYHLQDYSGWLEERVTSQSYWSKISSCIRDSHVCGKMRRTYNRGIPEPVEMFNLRKLSPLEVSVE